PAEHLPDVLRREEDPPQVTLVSSLLGAVLGDLCVKMQLTQGLAATANDMKLLVRAVQRNEPVPVESALARGWRAQAILPELLAIIEGRRAVRVESLQRDDPLRFEG